MANFSLSRRRASVQASAELPLFLQIKAPGLEPSEDTDYKASSDHMTEFVNFQLQVKPDSFLSTVSRGSPIPEDTPPQGFRTPFGMFLPGRTENTV